MSRQSIDTSVARNLATTTKTPPQMAAISTRWLLRLLPWVNVDAGTYRVNRVRIVSKLPGKIAIRHDAGKVDLPPDALRAIPMFADLDAVLLEAMSSKLTQQNVAQGAKIVEEGKDSDKLYIIARGKVETGRSGEMGEKLRHRVLASGDFMGEDQLVGNVSSCYSARALSPCLLLVLTKKALKETLAKLPMQRASFEAAMARQLDQRAKANRYGEKMVGLEAGHAGEPDLPEASIDYDPNPREYPLSLVQTLVRLHTRVSDLYNVPLNQLHEQIRLTVEGMKEAQEWQIINNPEFGLLKLAEPSMRIQTRVGPPTPDDMDELLSLVWKKPAFFLAHPRAIAAFGRECTRRGVPPPTTQIYGSPFLTWRGVPIVPCNKLDVANYEGCENGAGRTNILLMRVGEADQGVVGLHQLGIPGEIMPSLSVRLTDINQKAVATYLLTLYFSCAALVGDALGVLENVEVGFYHEYA